MSKATISIRSERSFTPERLKRYMTDRISEERDGGSRKGFKAKVLSIAFISRLVSLLCSLKVYIEDS